MVHKTIKAIAKNSNKNNIKIIIHNTEKKKRRRRRKTTEVGTKKPSQYTPNYNISNYSTPPAPQYPNYAPYPPYPPAQFQDPYAQPNPILQHIPAPVPIYAPDPVHLGVPIHAPAPVPLGVIIHDPVPVPAHPIHPVPMPNPLLNQIINFRHRAPIIEPEVVPVPNPLLEEIRNTRLRLNPLHDQVILPPIVDTQTQLMRQISNRQLQTPEQVEYNLDEFERKRKQQLDELKSVPNKLELEIRDIKNNPRFGKRELIGKSKWDDDDEYQPKPKRTSILETPNNKEFVQDIETPFLTPLLHGKKTINNAILYDKPAPTIYDEVLDITPKPTINDLMLDTHKHNENIEETEKNINEHEKQLELEYDKIFEEPQTIINEPQTIINEPKKDLKNPKDRGKLGQQVKQQKAIENDPDYLLKQEQKEKERVEKADENRKLQEMKYNKEAEVHERIAQTFKTHNFRKDQKGIYIKLINDAIAKTKKRENLSDNEVKTINKLLNLSPEFYESSGKMKIIRKTTNEHDLDALIQPIKTILNSL